MGGKLKMPLTAVDESLTDLEGLGGPHGWVELVGIGVGNLVLGEEILGDLSHGGPGLLAKRLHKIINLFREFNTKYIEGILKK